MNFEQLAPAAAGTVELLELTWPPFPGPEDARSCFCYVVLLRPEGFLLCVPARFWEDEDIPGDGIEEGYESVGPHHRITAPPVSLTAAGSWTTPADRTPVPVLLIDFPAPLAGALAPVDFDSFAGTPFASDFSIFPLATEVIAPARWIQGIEGEEAAAYQSALSEAEPPPPAKPAEPKRASKAKRPTVADLAQQQAALFDAVSKLAEEMTKMRQESGPPAQPEGPPVPSPAQALGPKAGALSAPLSSVLPPTQAVPKGLAHLLGPPPPARALAHAAPRQRDLDQQLAAGISDGELPLVEPDPPTLTAALLAQSQALVSLVNQMAQGSDPLLDAAPSGSTAIRGSVNRQRLQQELAQKTGSFADKVAAQAARRMNPTGMLTPRSARPLSLLRTLWRFLPPKGAGNDCLAGFPSLRHAPAGRHVGGPRCAGSC